MGTLNLLSATVVDPATGRVTVDSQPLTGIDAMRECRSGETVTLALRPEAISLDVAGTENSSRATMDDVIFLGGLVRVRLSAQTSQSGPAEPSGHRPPRPW